MSRWLVLLTLVGAALGFAGCASDDPVTGRQTESSIPWNRPQNWEGAGAYGSAMNQGH
jgi:hypothetical protein